MPIKELPKKSRTALINYAKSDHSQIGQLLVDSISPRLDANDAKVFKKFVQDVLFIKEELKSAQGGLESVLMERATQDYGFFPNKSWIEKCVQIHNLSNTYKGIILCGPPASGKSSTLQVLVDALTQISRSTSAHRNNQVFKKQTSATLSHKIVKYLFFLNLILSSCTSGFIIKLN